MLLSVSMPLIGSQSMKREAGSKSEQTEPDAKAISPIEATVSGLYPDVSVGGFP